MEGQFRATHAVRLPDGSLEESHEHTWRVTATFRSNRLDPTMGVVVDFLKVEAALSAIAAELEGRDLNSMDEFSQTGPSAEKVACYLAGRLAELLKGEGKLYCVSVTEAPNCRAAFYP